MQLQKGRKKFCLNSSIVAMMIIFNILTMVVVLLEIFFCHKR